MPVLLDSSSDQDVIRYLRQWRPSELNSCHISQTSLDSPSFSHKFLFIDTQIVKACLQQDRTAQRQLYDQLLPYLRGVCRRYLRNDSFTMDVLQESFIKLFRSLDRYDSNRAPLKSWAARIVINTCLNYNDRVIGAPTDELSELDEPVETPATVVETDWAKLTDDRLLGLLRRMPTGYLEVFNLFVIDGYSHQEVANLLSINETTSRQKLTRAKAWLRRSATSQFLLTPKS